MALPAAFRGHGTFIYSARGTTHAYGSPEAVADAMVRCGMSSAWLRVHGRTDNFANNGATRDLFAALRDRGIAVAGWGWCQGDDPVREAALAVESLGDLGLTDYVADIEQGVNQAHWTPGEVATFLDRVRRALPSAAHIAVSSFPIITWHVPALMVAADPYVDAFAPQAYWFRYPNAKMRNEFGTRYASDNAAAYVRLTIDNWRSITAKPLIATGQAYWREGATQEQSESKVTQFLRDFTAWDELAGFNWWHFGGGDAAMSQAMRDEIAAARLDAKPFSNAV
jgi:hypothetical protein